MNDPYSFPAVQLLDPLGTKIVLSEDASQEGCCALSITARHGGDPEAILNRSTAILLRRALGLWIEYLDTALMPDDDDLDE